MRRQDSSDRHRVTTVPNKVKYPTRPKESNSRDYNQSTYRIGAGLGARLTGHSFHCIFSPLSSTFKTGHFWCVSSSGRHFHRQHNALPLQDVSVPLILGTDRRTLLLLSPCHSIQCVPRVREAVEYGNRSNRITVDKVHNLSRILIQKLNTIHTQLFPVKIISKNWKWTVEKVFQKNVYIAIERIVTPVLFDK